MKRIILHWTGGANVSNATDLQHYHYVIHGDGRVKEGKFPVSANEVCKTDVKGNALYSAHTGGGNTGSIGVAVCGMAGFKSSKDVGKYPLSKVQVERMFSFTAELCKKYGFKVSPETVMTHYEFGKTHPKTSSAGKIDIVYLPSYPEVTREKVGDFIRSKVQWYLNKL